MEEHIERNKRVLEQWERFHRQEPVDESAVRPLILRSWKRCRLQGVRPDNASKVSLSPAALEKLLDRNADLVAVAKSIMEKLYNPISTSRSFISLSDAQGIVLHALWDNTGSYPIPHRRKAPRGPMPSGRASWNIRLWRRWLRNITAARSTAGSARRPLSGTAGTPSSACSM